MNEQKDGSPIKSYRRAPINLPPPITERSTPEGGTPTTDSTTTNKTASKAIARENIDPDKLLNTPREDIQAGKAQIDKIIETTGEIPTWEERRKIYLEEERKAGRKK